MKLRRRAKNLWTVVRGTVAEFNGDQPDVMNYSATIAFYTIFSLPAALLFIVTIAGFLYDQEAVRQQLFVEMGKYLGEKNTQLAETVMSNINNEHSGLIASIVGGATLILSATTVFITIQNALNHIWNVRVKRGKGFKSYLKLVIDRLLSFLMVGSLGLLIVVSTLADTLLSVFEDMLEYFLGYYTVQLMQVASYSVGIIIMALAVAILFKTLPAVRVDWRDAFLGGVVTALLFSLGKYLIKLYMSNSPLGTTYGAAGSFVIFLIWIYFSAAIFLFGAEFTYVFARTFGHDMGPKSNAEYVPGNSVIDAQLLAEEEKSNLGA
ncbi:MAG: YihY/virulence factor BrkB family protein [Cytophagales bacterium]|nr:YihY/virulence factor BrkB family protein [Cytophagales bacterium]